MINFRRHRSKPGCSLKGRAMICRILVLVIPALLSGTATAADSVATKEDFVWLCDHLEGTWESFSTAESDQPERGIKAGDVLVRTVEYRRMANGHALQWQQRTPNGSNLGLIAFDAQSKTIRGFFTSTRGSHWENTYQRVDDNLWKAELQNATLSDGRTVHGWANWQFDADGRNLSLEGEMRVGDEEPKSRKWRLVKISERTDAIKLVEESVGEFIRYFSMRDAKKLSTVFAEDRKSVV